MALRPCRECGSQISDKATACPKCGAPVVTAARTVRSAASRLWLVTKLLVGLLVLVIVYTCTTTLQKASDRATTSTSAVPPVSPLSVAPVVATSPTPTPREPPTKEELAANAAEEKEEKRIAALDYTSFCMKELRKLRKIKGTPNQAWFSALSKRANQVDVYGHHLTLIQDGQVEMGMPVCAAIASWGRPESINRTETANVKHEQWVYGGGKYLYFNDDKLTSVQTSR